MIKELRKKFIRIAMISITLVMVIFCATVNGANYLSVESELTQMLDMICQNQGNLPPLPPGGFPGGKPDGPFNVETLYSTRYFVLRYTDSGDLVQADLSRIAAVTEDDAADYVAVARKHGEGYGYTSGYKYYVQSEGNGRWMAVFLDCHQESRWCLTLGILSLSAMAVCILLVYGNTAQKKERDSAKCDIMKLWINR